MCSARRVPRRCAWPRCCRDARWDRRRRQPQRSPEAFTCISSGSPGPTPTPTPGPTLPYRLCALLPSWRSLGLAGQGVDGGGRDRAAPAPAVHDQVLERGRVLRERELGLRRADEADGDADHGGRAGPPSATISSSLNNAVGALPTTTSEPSRRSRQRASDGPCSCRLGPQLRVLHVRSPSGRWPRSARRPPAPGPARPRASSRHTQPSGCRSPPRSGDTLRLAAPLRPARRASRWSMER